jgi:TolB protein
VELTGLRDTCHEFYSYPVTAVVVAGAVADVDLGIECLGIPPEVYFVYTLSEFTLDPPRMDLVGLTEGGVSPLRLTFHPAADRSADWSPDGTRLAFSRDGVIHVMSVDGTELRSFHEGTNPDWSPDGTRIAFDNGTRTFLFEPDGNTARVFVGDGTAPAWSPDGSRIAVDDLVTQSETDIFVMSPTGQNRTNVTDDPYRADREPSWSPDGSRMVFRRLNRTLSTGYDVWIMDADGSNPTEVFAEPGPDTAPEWLPGDRIVFSTGPGGLALLDLGDATMSYVVSPPGGTTVVFGADWRPTP